MAASHKSRPAQYLRTGQPAAGLLRRERVQVRPGMRCTVEAWVREDGVPIHPMTRLRGADGVYSASEWLETEHDVIEVVS